MPHTAYCYLCNCYDVSLTYCKEMCQCIQGSQEAPRYQRRSRLGRAESS